MNSKDPRYWLRDYTDNELDEEIDRTRGQLMMFHAHRMEHPHDTAMFMRHRCCQEWFLALLEESAERWRSFDIKHNLRKSSIKQ